MSAIQAASMRRAPQTRTEDGAGDILRGVKAITAYLQVLMGDPTVDERLGYHWCSHGFIPATKVGALWIASKTAIRERLQTPTNQRQSAEEAARPERNGWPKRNTAEG
jgi:hypothetical protein